MTRFKPKPWGATPASAVALEDLYRNPSGRLVARLRRRFGDALAEDIAQDVQRVCAERGHFNDELGRCFKAAATLPQKAWTAGSAGEPTSQKA